MKIIYTLLLLTTITISSISQTFLTEDFSEGIMPPSGWTIDNYAQQWNSNMSAMADGSAPEARFSYIETVGTSRLISPEIDLYGHESVIVKFKHYLDDWAHAGEYSLGVATRSGGGDWNNAWEIFPTYNLGPEEVLITIENDDVGAADFQFCIYIDGDLYNINYWYIDDISLFSAFNLDGEMQAVTTVPFVTETTLIEGIVSNKGLEPITSIEVSWQVDNNEIFISSFSGFNINMGETYSFECPDVFNYPIGIYELNVWLSSVNGTTDDNPENDILTKEISVVSNVVFKRTLLEQFASSNSYGAAVVNNTFVPWCEDHADSITLIKYPWRIPTPPDPYYNVECEAREVFYEIGSWEYEFIFWDGMEFTNSVNWLDSYFEEAIQQPGFASIVASRSTVSRGTVMDIDVTILPYANFNNHRLFAVVFEKTTTGNVGNNGETEFKNIMMKMVPDPYGTPISLNDREPTIITQSIDLEGTNIEEWDDLGVAIFIQNYDTREVFQSTYAVENANFATDATLGALNIDGTLVAGFNSGVYDYNVELPLGTTVVPEVTGVPTDENAIVIVVPTNELPGTTTTEVFAEDLSTKLTYNVNFTVITGFEDSAAANVKLYPNPTRGIVTIAGIKKATIEVYNISGKRISRFENSSGQIIDLSSQPNGVYIIKILEDNFVSTKRVILNR